MPKTSFAMIRCNSCGTTDKFEPNVEPEALKNDSKKVIEDVKRYFADEGWYTSWGYDLCPDCKSKVLEKEEQ